MLTILQDALGKRARLTRVQAGVEAGLGSRKLYQRVARSLAQIEAVVAQHLNVYAFTGEGRLQPRRQLRCPAPGTAFCAADVDGSVLFGLFHKGSSYHGVPERSVILDKDNIVK